MIFGLEKEQDWSLLASQDNVSTLTSSCTVILGANALSLVRVKEDVNLSDDELDRISEGLAFYRDFHDLSPEEVMAALVTLEPVLGQNWEPITEPKQ